MTLVGSRFPYNKALSNVLFPTLLRPMSAISGICEAFLGKAFMSLFVVVVTPVDVVLTAMVSVVVEERCDDVVCSGVSVTTTASGPTLPINRTGNDFGPKGGGGINDSWVVS